MLPGAEPSGAQSELLGISFEVSITQIMDNVRVHAWRVILEPGQSIGQIMQSAPGLRVYMHGGVFAEVIPGNADRGMAPYDGDFIWKDAGKRAASRTPERRASNSSNSS